MYKIQNLGNDRANLLYNGRVIIVNASLWYVTKRYNELTKTKKG